MTVHPRFFRLFAAFLVALAASTVPASPGGKWTYWVPGNDVQDVAFHGDDVWCATHFSIVRWDRRNGTYTQIPTGGEDYPGDIEADAKGNVWIRYPGGRASRFDGAAWNRFDNTNSPIARKGIDQTIDSMCADRSGNMWFSVPGTGVVRYDGSSWKEYAPGDSIRYVYGTARDPDGSLWFAADSGAWRLSGGRWKRYGPEDGLADRAVYSVAVDKEGVKWFGTAKGITRYDEATWKTFDEADGVTLSRMNTAAIDSAGNVWFGSDGGIVRIRDGAVEVFLAGQGPKRGKVAAIAVDRSDRVWFCHNAPAAGMSVFDHGAWSYIPIPGDASELPVRAAACDSAGVLWFAVQGYGVVSFDGAAWRGYTVGDGLSSTMIRSIFVDSAGRIWFSYWGNGGATCFDGVSWKTWTINDGLRSDAVMAVCERVGGTIVVCAMGGVSRLDGGRWVDVPYAERLVSDVITDMAQAPDGAMWFATFCGLSRFDGVSWRTWTTGDGLPANGVDGVDIGGDSRVWFTAGGRLCNITAGSLAVHPAPPDTTTGKSLPLGRVAVGGEGAVWACSGGWHSTGYNLYRDRGLWRFRNGSWEPFPLGFGMSNRVGNIRADDRGTIWYVTSLGLARWDGAERRLFRVNAPDHVMAAEIVADHDGTVWLASAEVSAVTHVSSFSGDRWNVYAPGTSLELCSMEIRVDEKNRIWFEGFKYLEGDSLKEMFSGIKLPNDGWTMGFAIERNGSAVWFGSGEKGLFRWDGASWTNYTTADGLSSNNVTPLAFGPEGTLWCAAGAYPDPWSVDWFDGRSWRSRRTTGYAYAAVFGKDGAVWIGTSKGLLRFNGVEWTEFTDLGVLGPVRSVVSLAVDEDSILWACTFMDGAFRYDGREWKRYTVENGLLSNRMSAVGVDRRNRKWFATGAGYCVLDDGAPDGVTDAAPAPLTLLGNRPNPFNAGTVIEFLSGSSGAAALDIHDILGRRVRSIETGPLPVGRNTIAWDGADDRGAKVSSGVYLYRVETGGHIAAGKMLMIK